MNLASSPRRFSQVSSQTTVSQNPSCLPSQSYNVKQWYQVWWRWILTERHLLIAVVCEQGREDEPKRALLLSSVPPSEEALVQGQS